MSTERVEHWSEQIPDNGLHEFIEEHWHGFPEEYVYESPDKEAEVAESSNPIVLMFTAGFETAATIIGSIFKFPLELMGKIGEI